MSIEPVIEKLIGKYERKVASNPDVAEKVKDVRKTVHANIGEEHFSFTVDGPKINDYRVGANPDADITVICSPEDFMALVDGDLRPMKAYVTKRLVIKGKIQDIMHLKNLF